MARDSEALSRINILLLSSLWRLPMHGYELKLELQYKHTAWWAKCEHGHLYAALRRLEELRFIRGKDQRQGQRVRRVFSITNAGRRWLSSALGALATARDTNYFDVDLFVAAAFTLEQTEAVRLLTERARGLETQCREAEVLRDRMRGLVPAAAELVMSHRIEHFAREAAFAARAAEVLEAQKQWRPFLGAESIIDFVRRTSVPLEPELKAPANTRARPTRAPKSVRGRRHSSARSASSGARKRQKAR